MLLADVLRRGKAVAHDRAGGDRGVDRDGEQVVEVEAHVTARRERGQQLGRARGDRLAPSDGIGDDELAVACVCDVGAALAADQQASEIVPGTMHVVGAIEEAVETTGGHVAERQRGRTERSELTPPRLVRRHADDRHHRAVHRGDLGGREALAVEPRALSPHRGVASAGGAVLDVGAERAVGIERAQRDAPVRDTARTVRGSVDRVDHHGDLGIVVAAPLRFLAQDADGQGGEHGEDCGVGDRVEVVLAQPVGASPTLDAREPGQRRSLRGGGVGKGLEQIVGRHSGSTVTTAL